MKVAMYVDRQMYILGHWLVVSLQENFSDETITSHNVNRLTLCTILTLEFRRTQTLISFVSKSRLARAIVLTRFLSTGILRREERRIKF